jgi:hypothetical protein
MAEILKSVIAVIGIVIGKNSFHVVGPYRTSRQAIYLHYRNGLGDSPGGPGSVSRPCLLPPHSSVRGEVSLPAKLRQPEAARANLRLKRFEAIRIAARAMTFGKEDGAT